MNALVVILAPLAIALFALVMERFEAIVVGTRGERAADKTVVASPPANDGAGIDGAGIDGAGTPEDGVGGGAADGERATGSGPERADGPGPGGARPDDEV